MPAKRPPAVIAPNLGLYLDRPAIAVPPGALSAGMNFRIKDGRYTNFNIGYRRFQTFQLNGPVKLVFGYYKSDGTNRLVFATLTDLYRYNVGTTNVKFITPSYVTGTAASAGTAVTGTGTLWAANVKIGDQISFGSAAQNDPAATWYTITGGITNTTLTIAPTSGIVVDGPYTIRKLFTGTFLDTWDADLFIHASPGPVDLAFFTNGVDKIVKWDGDTTFATFSSITQKAKHLLVWGDMLILGAPDDGTPHPTDILNSDVGVPEDMVNGLATQLQVHPGGDAIKRLLPLVDTVAIYSERSVTLAQFVGDPIVWAFRQAIPNFGIVGTHAVASFGPYHELIAADGQYQFDGVNVKNIGTQVWKSILSQRDPQRNDILFSHFYDEEGELIWAVPLTSDTNAATSTTVAPAQAWTEHYLETVGPNTPMPYGTRFFPFTAAGYYTVQAQETWADDAGQWDSDTTRWDDNAGFANFPLSVVGAIDGKVYTLGGSGEADTAALVSYVKFGRRATGDGRMRGLLTRVYPFASSPSGGAYNLSVTVYMADTAAADGTAVTPGNFDLTLPEGGHFTPIYRRGRFFEVQFGTAGPAQPYQISGYDVDVRPGGLR